MDKYRYIISFDLNDDDDLSRLQLAMRLMSPVLSDEGTFDVKRKLLEKDVHETEADLSGISLASLCMGGAE